MCCLYTTVYCHVWVSCWCEGINDYAIKNTENSMSCYLWNILKVAKDKKVLSHCRITGQLNCINDNY